MSTQKNRIKTQQTKIKKHNNTFKNVINLEKSIHAGKYSNVDLDQSKDLPYN